MGASPVSAQRCRGAGGRRSAAGRQRAAPGSGAAPPLGNPGAGAGLGAGRGAEKQRAPDAAQPGGERCPCARTGHERGRCSPPGPAVPYLFRAGTGLPEQVPLGRSRSLLAGGPEGFLGHRKAAGHRVRAADPARTVRAVQRAARLRCLSGCMDRVGDRKAKEAVLGVLGFPSLLTKLFGCPQSWAVRARATAEPEQPTAGRDGISLSSSKAPAWLLPRSGPTSQRS